MLILQTDRLIIRGFLPEDTERIYQYSQEQCTKDELPDEVFESVEFTSTLLAQLNGNDENRTLPLVYAIALRESNIPIGHVSLSSIGDGKIEVGYAVAEGYQQHGYAKEVVRPFVEWALLNLDLDGIHGIVKAANHASVHVLEAAGFTFLREEQRDFWGQEHLMRLYVFQKTGMNARRTVSSQGGRVMISPAIHFPGNCHEAILFYEEVFRGTDRKIEFYRDAPTNPGFEVSKDMLDQVMHASMTLNGSPFNFSDTQDKTLSGDMICFNVFLESEDEVSRAFEKLADRGQVAVPLGPQFFSRMYASVTDRFGVKWQLICSCDEGGIK